MIWRVGAVAKVSFFEFLRSRCLFLLFFVFLFQWISWHFMGQSPVEARVRSLQVCTLWAFDIFILLGLLVLSSENFSRDVAYRYVHLIFVKPIRSWEFLLGKMLGLWLLLFFLTLVSGLFLQVFISNLEGEKTVRERVWAQEISGQTKKGAFRLLPGKEPVTWVSQPLSDDFLSENCDVVVDLRRFFPGQWVELEIQGGEALKSYRLTSQKVHRLAFSGVDQKSQQSELKFRLLASSFEGPLILNAKKIWLEGKHHPVSVNAWRSLVVLSFHLMLVCALTLVASIFFSRPTSMLLGFTFFVVSSHLSVLEQLPEVLSSGIKAPHTHEHGAHSHHESRHESHQGHEKETHHDFGQWIKPMVSTLVFVLPDFESRSPGVYLNRSQYIPAVVFWGSFFTMIQGVALILCWGGFFVGRREVLT